MLFCRQFNYSDFRQTGEADGLQNLMEAVLERVFLYRDGAEHVTCNEYASASAGRSIVGTPCVTP